MPKNARLALEEMLTALHRDGLDESDLTYWLLDRLQIVAEVVRDRLPGVAVDIRVGFGELVH